MRKSAILLVGILVIFIFLGILMMQSLVIVQRIASVSDVAGEVLVRTATDEQFKPLANAEHVLAGYTVRTGAEGAVTLNWVDGSRVRLGPETSIKVRKCSLNTSTKERTSLFDLDAGQIWVRVLSALGGKTKFEIRTPTATAGVRGTVFSVAVDESGETNVAVYEGKVSVDAEDHTTVVEPGLEATVGENRDIAEQEAEGIDWEDQQGIVGPRLDLDAGESVTVPEGAKAVEISGISEPNATVKINGSPVGLTNSNRFTAQVPLDGASDGLIVVSATDYRGARTARAISIKTD